MKPKRIQLKRAKGWRMPIGAVKVDRSTRWGNPFPEKHLTWIAVAMGNRGDKEGRVATSIHLFRIWLGLKEYEPANELPADKFEPSITYGNGATATMEQHCRGIAAMAAQFDLAEIGEIPKPPTLDEIRRELRGKDLACWCPLDGPCHAEVLLEIANAP